jgi:hypothetical protein
MQRRTATCVLAVVCLAALGGTCTSNGPQLSLTLHQVSDDLNDLLVVPTDSALIINASFAPSQGGSVLPGTFRADLFPWDGQSEQPAVVLVADADGATAVVPPAILREGTYTVVASLEDTSGATGWARLDLAVRARLGAPPIGTGQHIWYDFSVDRDATGGPDFPVDLQTFGLGSPSQPALSAQVEETVIDAVLERVSQVYHDGELPGLSIPDPVAISLSRLDPGTGDVTRICVGGEDPSGGSLIGSILIDPNNGNRDSVECSNVPPTGIFPRGLMAFQGQTAFRTTFDPLMSSRGGTPVGEHALDPIVLDAAFDPGSASPEELTRHLEIETAIQRFGDALGSIAAHETGHALGLVMPGPPGGGLHGGQVGPEFSHDVTSDGSTSPPENYLMKQGGSFTFAKLAGLGGHPLPFLRPLDFAYLRDRVMLDARITELLPPPAVDAVTPTSIDTSVQIEVVGTGFAATPSVRLVNETYSYETIGESLESETLVRAWVISSQVPPGTYDLELQNPDGQTASLPDGIVVTP